MITVTSTKCIVYSSGSAIVYSFVVRACLAEHIGYSENSVVDCPFNNGEYKCQFTLQDREIRAVSSFAFFIYSCINV